MRKPKFLRCIKFFICLLLFQYGTAQTPYTIQYTEADGLPSMTVYNVLQDSKGFLWIATENGLCRFDGYEFQLYESPLIEDMDMPGIYIGNDDRVWFWNFAGQLFYLEDNEIKKFNPNNVLDSANVYNIYEDAEKRLWIFKQYLPIYCPTPENCKEVARLDELNPFLEQIYKSNDSKNFYFSSNHLCALRDDEIMETITKSLIVVTPSDKMYSLNNRDLKVYEYQLDNKSIKPVFELAQNQTMIRLFEDNNENTWINTNKSILMFDKNRQSIQLNFPQFKNVNSINQDKDGNYWFATNGNGLFMLPNTQILTLNQSESPLKNEDIVDIVEIDKKSTAIATHQGNIFILDNETNQVKQQVNVGGKIIYFSEKESTDNYWININGLTYEMTKDFQRIGTGYHWGATDCIIERDNGVWITNENQTIHEISNKLGQYHRYYGKNSLMNIFSRSHKIIFLPNSDDALIGSKKGLFQGKNKTNKKIKKTIYDANGQKQSFWIKDLLYDEDRDLLWLGTQTKGVVAVQSDTIVYHFSTKNNLVSNNVNLIEKDEDGIWVGTIKGLNYINFKTKEIKLFDSGDGLPSNNIKVIHVRKDKVWVGTPVGMAFLDQDLKNKSSALPSIYISSIQINDRDTTILDEYHLKFNQNNLTFHFIAPAFANQKRFSYQYRMIGLDTIWTNTTNTEIRFPALNHGKYIFEVRTINNEGRINDKVERVQIFISKPYWRTWWFIVLVSALSLGLVSLVTFWITRFYRKQQEERLSFRRQVTESRMQALQSQMNPHFIFNALNAIQHFFTTNEKELAMLHLNKFAKLIRLIFEYSKERTIAINREIEFLNLYLELEKLRFGNKVNVDFEVEDIVHEVNLYIPPLLIQPMIENAFKHGLLHKEDTGNLKVIFKMKDDKKVICVIEDDGIGREAAKRFAKWKLKEHRSSGIKSTNERIELYNQENPKMPIALIIKDLGTTKKPLGTRIIFEFTLIEED